MENLSEDYQQLASYRHCNERIATQWEAFQMRRADMADTLGASLNATRTAQRLLCVLELI